MLIFCFKSETGIIILYLLNSEDSNTDYGVYSNVQRTLLQGTFYDEQKKAAENPPPFKLFRVSCSLQCININNYPF